MKRYIFLILTLLIVTSCSNENQKAYINGTEYNVNDSINVNIIFDSEEKDVSLCPIIKVVKDNEKDYSNIVEYLDYNIDNLKVNNYLIKELLEDYTSDKWILKFNLNQLSDDNIDIVKKIVELKLKVKEPGNYQITFDDSNEECFTKYKDNLKLEVVKN